MLGLRGVQAPSYMRDLTRPEKSTMQASANLNVMMKAARAAGRSLAKDFREVEQLQVSMKGAGDLQTSYMACRIGRFP